MESMDMGQVIDLGFESRHQWRDICEGIKRPEMPWWVEYMDAPHDCTPKSLFGSTHAAGMNEGLNEKNPWKLVHENDWDPETQRALARVLGRGNARQVKNYPNKVDRDKAAQLAKQGLGKMQGIDWLANGSRTMSSLTAEKIYTQTDTRLERWWQKWRNAPSEKAAKAYQRTIAKDFRRALDKLDQVLVETEENSNARFRRLEKMGIPPDKLHHTRIYLEWLSNGGPFFDFRPGKNDPTGFIDAVKNVKRKYVENNPLIALYNLQEILQKSTLYSDKPATLLKGYRNAFTNSGGKLWQRIPEVEKGGYYHFNAFDEPDPKGKWDIVNSTNNMLVNVAYYIGKADGNIPKALKEIAYVRRPWDVNYLLMNPTTNLAFSLMRFQFDHMNQYAGMWKALYKGGKAKDMNQIRIAATHLTAYHGLLGTMFGGKAMFPPIVWGIMKVFFPNIEEDISEAEKGLPTNLLKKATGLDASEVTAPLNFARAGVAFDMVNTVVEAVTEGIPRAGQKISEGQLNQDPNDIYAGVLDLMYYLGKSSYAWAPQLPINESVLKTVKAIRKTVDEDEGLSELFKENIWESLFRLKAEEE